MADKPKWAGATGAGPVKPAAGGPIDWDKRDADDYRKEKNKMFTWQPKDTDKDWVSYREERRKKRAKPMAPVPAPTAPGLTDLAKPK